MGKIVVSSFVSGVIIGVAMPALVDGVLGSMEWYARRQKDTKAPAEPVIKEAAAA